MPTTKGGSRALLKALRTVMAGTGDGQARLDQVVRLVASRRLDMPSDGKLAQTAGSVPVWLLHGPGSNTAPWEGTEVRLLECPLGAGRQLDPAGMLQVLGAQGLTRVYCEGGGVLAGALLAAGVVDELVGFTAGIALGAEGQPALGAMGIDSLAAAPRFRLVETRALGGDIFHRWRSAP